jgi:CheY-like chemotaxis protein
MAQILLTSDDSSALLELGPILREAGGSVMTARSGRQTLDLLTQGTVDLAVFDMRLADMSGLDLLRMLRARTERRIPVVFVTASGTTRDAVTAIQLGAADFLKQPVSRETIVETVAATLERHARPSRRAAAAGGLDGQQGHPAVRLARVVVPVLDSSRDPRTLTEWSRLVFVPPGALRNWCRMAGLSPRRWLVFARLLRAVSLAHRGQHKPENLLDVVDRRTLVGLLRFAGLDPEGGFPHTIDAFLQQQVLVRDRETLSEIKRALAARDVTVSAGSTSPPPG